MCTRRPFAIPLGGRWPRHCTHAQSTCRQRRLQWPWYSLRRCRPKIAREASSISPASLVDVWVLVYGSCASSDRPTDPALGYPRVGPAMMATAAVAALLLRSGFNLVSVFDLLRLRIPMLYLYKHELLRILAIITSTDLPMRSYFPRTLESRHSIPAASRIRQPQ